MDILLYKVLFPLYGLKKLMLDLMLTNSKMPAKNILGRLPQTVSHIKPKKSPFLIGKFKVWTCIITTISPCVLPTIILAKLVASWNGCTRHVYHQQHMSVHLETKVHNCIHHPHRIFLASRDACRSNQDTMISGMASTTHFWSRVIIWQNQCGKAYRKDVPRLLSMSVYICLILWD